MHELNLYYGSLKVDFFQVEMTSERDIRKCYLILIFTPDTFDFESISTHYLDDELWIHNDSSF